MLDAGGRAAVERLAVEGRALKSAATIDRDAIYDLKDTALRRCFAAIDALPGRREALEAFRSRDGGGGGVGSVEDGRAPGASKWQHQDNLSIRAASNVWYGWSQQAGAVCAPYGSDPTWVFADSGTDALYANTGTNGICP